MVRRAGWFPGWGPGLLGAWCGSWQGLGLLVKGSEGDKVTADTYRNVIPPSRIRSQPVKEL